MRRRTRGLSSEERALWEAHARRYRPLARKAVAPTPKEERAPAPEPGPRRAAKGPGPRLGQGEPIHGVASASPKPEPLPKAAPIASFHVGERARALGSAASPSSAPSPSAPIPADRKARRALQRGRLRPEARIDLHGMTLERAHPALLGFIARAHGDGLRLVLVITGKGRVEEDTEPLARPRGVLRRQVPLWLDQPPLSGIVQGIAPAHRRHGGEGALYVRLRRR